MKPLMIALMAAVLALPVVAAAEPHGQRGGGGGGHGGGGRAAYGAPAGGYGGPRFGGGAPHYGAPVYGGGPRYAAPPAYVHPPAYARPPAYGRPQAYGPPPAFGGPRSREGYQDYARPAQGGLRRGQFLPQTERGYMVGDYYRYHLRRPPPGYDWYRSGDDFVLAAIASGLIFEVVAGDGY